MYENMDISVLLQMARDGDKGAEGYLVESNVGLVRSVARRFAGRGVDREDLFQIGCVGLIKAVQKFDPSFEVMFSTYAVPMIMGEIKRFIRDDGLIKVSRSLKELTARAMNAKERLQRELGREPSVKEIAASLGVSCEELAVALESGIAPESIYGGGDEGLSLIDKIESPLDHEGEVLNRMVVNEALSTLPPRERQIIVLRYFKRKTQSQIAEMLGISQVQVSRIEKKVLLELRQKISG